MPAGPDPHRCRSGGRRRGAGGLLRISEDGVIEILSDGSDRRAFRFVDDVDVAPDGRLYFSDASHRYGSDQLMHDFFAHAGTGCLLRYDPATGSTETLLDGLYCANGIAVGLNGDCVLFTETARYQVTRYWIQGERADQPEVFIDDLPGFPDNICFDGEGRLWLALHAPRDAALDAILPRPWLRSILFRLPRPCIPSQKYWLPWSGWISRVGWWPLLRPAAKASLAPSPPSSSRGADSPRAV